MAVRWKVFMPLVLLGKGDCYSRDMDITLHGHLFLVVVLDVLLRRLVGLFEAIRSYVSDERTSAHAWGIAAPPSCMGRLPEVGSSFGLMLVSTGKARIRA
jgi:hypothetical protein